VSTREVEIEGTAYVLRAEPPRTSLTDDAHTLWGFNIEVMKGGAPVCIKTCFVGRVSMQARHPDALVGPAAEISAAVHSLAFDKVVESLAKGDLNDGIVFA
jgi:hypothetical protein